MKTNRKTMTLALALALIVTFTGLANAQGHGMRGHGARGCGMGALTPEQQAVMQKFHAEHTAATAELRQQVFVKESELNAQLYAEKPDEARINALTKDIGELRAKLYADHVALRKQLAGTGIMPMGGSGCGMMGGKGHGMGGMNCPMTSGMNAGNVPTAETPAQQ
ncbi:MAG: periplasmic heavy metal sensor [Deltaproteobacteria bacterium]|nr:periplasmic heavy metal sensor [Deltaproteobacteria bacterium]